MEPDERRRQAIALLEEIVREVALHDSDTVDLLAKLYHAYGLAELPRDWIENELSGYWIGAEPQPVPWYRKQIRGVAMWEFLGPPAHPALAVNLNLAGPEPHEPVEVDWRLDIRMTNQYAHAGGFQEALPERRERSHFLGVYQQQRVISYSALWMSHILNHVRNEILRHASKTIINLRYGDTVGQIWESYRVAVDAALERLELGADFANIRQNVTSENPEQWRSAMWACRSVLHNLAARLWTDPSPTYRPLNNMKVDGNSPLNRLLAYLHCKGITGPVRQYLDAELESINTSLHALSDLDNKAHKTEAPSGQDTLLAVVATYNVLAQFANRTDLEPVADQAVCIAGD